MRTQSRLHCKPAAGSRVHRGAVVPGVAGGRRDHGEPDPRRRHGGGQVHTVQQGGALSRGLHGLSSFNQGEAFTKSNNFDAPIFL